MAEPARPDLEALLAQSGWIRHVARGLVSDAHLADDLVQDAWVAALEGHGEVRGSLRGWLAALVRNFARQRWRSEIRREQRELLAAHDETGEPHDELLERLDVHRALVEEVAALPDPYRSAILWRYFEGLSPKAIAERTHVPVRTVHSHLHRGLERLRERLDRRVSRKSDWLLALLPLPNKPSRLDAFRFGTRVMDPKLKLSWIAASAAGLLACSWILFASRDEPEPELANVAVNAPTESNDLSPPDPAAGSASLRASAVKGAVARAPAPRATASLRGHVIDVHNAPVAHVVLRFTSVGGESLPEWRTESAFDGSFEIPEPDADGSLDIASEDLVTVLKPLIRRGSPIGTRDDDHTLVVARRVHLAGDVRDDGGEPVRNAWLTLQPPALFRSRFDRVLDTAMLLEWRTRTDDDGRFQLPNAPVIPHAKLVATLDGCEPRALDDPAEDRLDLRFVLCRPSASAAALTGRVLHRDGSAAGSAWIALGDETVRSDAEGAFMLRVRPENDALAIVAATVGYQPARHERTVGVDGVAAWPKPLELVLGPPALSIAGHVREIDGRAVEGVEVWAVDSTHFGYVDARSWGINGMVPVRLEQVLREDPFTDRVRTDGGGAFAIGGLLPRAYRLCAFDSRSLRAIVTSPIDAGSAATEIVLPDEERYERVAGRVVDRSGKPVPGTEVMLVRIVPELEGVDYEGPELWTPPMRTDPEGRFEYTSVSRVRSLVRVCAITFESAADVVLATQPDVEKLDIAIALKAHLQVDVADGAIHADAFEVLDARGRTMRLSASLGNVSEFLERVPISGSRSEPVIATEDAAEIVFYAKDAAVKRVPVRLVPGELNVVRP